MAKKWLLFIIKEKEEETERPSVLHHYQDAEAYSGELKSQHGWGLNIR